MKLDVKRLVDDVKERVTTYRRDLHRNPELSGQEYHTQRYIQEVLNHCDIPHVVADRTGVVATIHAKPGGKIVALRADIDALPIVETQSHACRSQNDGVMHACGHDAHTAILLGVACVLNQIKDELNGSVKLIFQPDEEVSGAARRIVAEGHLDDVDVVLGLHVMPYLQVGEIEVRDGVLNASSGTVTLDVRGKSAHGAYPDQGVDAIVIAANIVAALQTVISRSVSPLDPVVLTFGVVSGGVRPNIVADYVQLRGTLRTIRTETRRDVERRIREISQGIAAASGGMAEVTFAQGYPSLVNDKELNRHIVAQAQTMETIQTIRWKEHPSMGAEDFGYYQTKAKGAFFHLGCGNHEEGISSGLHTPEFAIDERCLAIGVELQVRNVLSLLNEELER